MLVLVELLFVIPFGLVLFLFIMGSKLFQRVERKLGTGEQTVRLPQPPESVISEDDSRRLEAPIEQIVSGVRVTVTRYQRSHGEENASLVKPDSSHGGLLDPYHLRIRCRPMNPGALDDLRARPKRRFFRVSWHDQVENLSFHLVDQVQSPCQVRLAEQLMLSGPFLDFLQTFYQVELPAFGQCGLILGDEGKDPVRIDWTRSELARYPPLVLFTCDAESLTAVFAVTELSRERWNNGFPREVQDDLIADAVRLTKSIGAVSDPLPERLEHVVRCSVSGGLRRDALNMLLQRFPEEPETERAWKVALESREPDVYDYLLREHREEVLRDISPDRILESLSNSRFRYAANELLSLESMLAERFPGGIFASLLEPSHSVELRFGVWCWYVNQASPEEIRTITRSFLESEDVDDQVRFLEVLEERHKLAAFETVLARAEHHSFLETGTTQRQDRLFGAMFSYLGNLSTSLTEEQRESWRHFLVKVLAQPEPSWFMQAARYARWSGSPEALRAILDRLPALSPEDQRELGETLQVLRREHGASLPSGALTLSVQEEKRGALTQAVADTGGLTVASEEPT